MQIEFVYRKQDGTLVRGCLDNWRERDGYLVGFSPDAKNIRSYRKDRVVEYLGDAESKLESPWTGPVKQPNKSNLRRSDKSIATVLFTGFSANDRCELESLAAQSGFRVVKSVTIGLDYICLGGNAGPSKAMNAAKAGAIPLDSAAFRLLVETGEIPDRTGHDDAHDIVDDDDDLASFLYGNSLPSRDVLTFLYPLDDSCHVHFSVTYWSEHPRHVEVWFNGSYQFFDKQLMVFVDVSYQHLKKPFIKPILAADAVEVRYLLDAANADALRAKVSESGFSHFVERVGITKNLNILVHGSSLSEKIWRQCISQGVVCCHVNDYLSFLNGYPLVGEHNPEFSGQRVKISLPDGDHDGCFKGWHFSICKAHLKSLDVVLQGMVSGDSWTRGLIPEFQFSPGDIFNSKIEQAISFQVDSVGPGHNGWIVVRQHIGNSKPTYFKCRQFEWPHFLQTGDFKLLIKVPVSKYEST